MTTLRNEGKQTCSALTKLLGVGLAIAFALAGPVVGAADNLALNPSFENGGAAPQGWTAGAASLLGPGRTGERSVGAKTEKETQVWTSQPIPIEAEQSYRLDGWLRCVRGRARLGLDFLDAQGKPVAALSAPAVSRASLPVHSLAGSWQFTAAESEVPQSALTARIWLRVSGEAYLDDVVLAPMVKNLVYNPGFDADSKGGIGMWTEEQLPGAKGSHKGDPAGRTGSSLLIEAGAGGWSVRCVAWPVVEGVTAYRFSGWARGEGAGPQIRIVWLDAWERVIQADRIEAAAGGGKGLAAAKGWKLYERRDLRPPEGAANITVAAGARGGKAWFDDFFFGAQAPAANKRPIARVLVNQVGCNIGAPKSSVVATNFFPADSETAYLEVVPTSPGAALRVPLVCQGRIHDGKPDDWGSYFWRADFSSLDQPGGYSAKAVVGKVAAVSPIFAIGQRALFRGTVNLGVEFFFVQRCGFAVPGWHEACHLDDANLPDGTHVDAVGGWHSAGDYNKIMYENGDGGCMYALVTAYLSEPDFFERTGQKPKSLPAVLDEALWGAKFVAKMQIPESGGLRNTVGQGPGRQWMRWLPPDIHTDNIVGTPDDPVIAAGEGRSPLAIGGWARLSVLLKGKGIENDYLERAVRLWNHATKEGTEVGGGDLLMSAVELHAVTGEQKYLEAAQRCAEAILKSQKDSGRHQGAFGSFGEVDAGALAFFALRYPQDPLKEKISAALRRYIAFCQTTADNPFGLSKESVGEQDYFFEPTSTLGHNWVLLTKAWAASLTYKLTGDEQALRFAVDQMDWVFGKNPYGLCMFEGKGAFNPPRYHHRYDSIPGRDRGAVPGTVPNGCVRTPSALDQPGFDLSRPAPGRRHASYRTSEPWLVHNLWFLMAISALP
jgi:hypothetical protein